MTGYESKRAAARDKLDNDDTQVYQDHDDTLTIAYQSGYYDGKKAAARDKDDALKLALEFVENVHLGEWQGSTERQEDIVTAINKALAQPAQKPSKQH